MRLLPGVAVALGGLVEFLLLGPCIFNLIGVVDVEIFFLHPRWHVAEPRVVALKRAAQEVAVELEEPRDAGPRPCRCAKL